MKPSEKPNKSTKSTEVGGKKLQDNIVGDLVSLFEGEDVSRENM